MGTFTGSQADEEEALRFSYFKLLPNAVLTVTAQGAAAYTLVSDHETSWQLL
jgi:hypothetical protein